MDRFDAVKTAKQYVSDLFEEEGISKTRLEEISFDECSRQWLITVGFAYLRGGGEARSPLAPSLVRAVYGDRVYKVVKIEDQSGAVVAMTDRLLDRV